MIQRYPGCVRGKWAPGKYVLFTDAEADKAEAVAVEQKKTAEMRAELAEWVERTFRCSADGYSKGWHEVIIGHNCMALAERLVELGTWERKPVGNNRVHYRPIESEASDD